MGLRRGQDTVTQKHRARQSGTGTELSQTPGEPRVTAQVTPAAAARERTATGMASISTGSGDTLRAVHEPRELPSVYCTAAEARGVRGLTVTWAFSSKVCFN